MHTCMQRYGFNVPANMYAAAALGRLLQLNAATWQSEDIRRRATQLLADIQGCLEQHAITTTPEGQRIYVYEFDGFGNVLHTFDDPNLPSLLALPLLGYPFDAEVCHWPMLPSMPGPGRPGEPLRAVLCSCHPSRVRLVCVACLLAARVHALHPESAIIPNPPSTVITTIHPSINHHRLRHTPRCTGPRVPAS